MKIQDGGVGQLTVLCDACGVPVGGMALVGLHHREQIIVHEHCKSVFEHYFRNSCERTLTLSQFVDELVAASE
jgi:hypothetical protein